MKTRLVILNFLQFAAWGAYLTCMGNYLGSAGLGDVIAWFYAIQGLVSIFMPTIMGIVADKWVQPQRLLGLCHLVAGLAMAGCWLMGLSTGFGGVIANRSLFITLYTISVGFYMPTLALSNTVAFSVLRDNGYDTVKSFPPIRVFGTVGFIAAMWFVNCAVWDGGRFFFTLGENVYKFQYTHMQFFVSSCLSVLLFAYTFTLPHCSIVRKEEKSWVDMLGLNAFRLFKTRKMAIFFIFSALLGMMLQVTNGFATPFITSFKVDPIYATTFGANNATLLTSLSQISEALCILLIPFFLRRYGIKVVMLIAMFAWMLRFGLFGLGDPGEGLWMFVLSMIVYGVAFDFFNVSGAMFVDKETGPVVDASAQGLFMLMSNGIGATTGTLVAGSVVNHFCQWNMIDGVAYLQGNWSAAWLILAGFALVVAVAFAILFRYKHSESKAE